MTLLRFLNQVKWAIDDENLNLGAMSGVHYSGDKAHILSLGRTALLWLARHAPVSMMGGSDEANETSGMLCDYAPSSTVMTLDTSDGTVTLPDDFVKLCRVRVKGWSRALQDVVDDTSEGYLMLGDAIATASADRPVAYIENGSSRKLVLCPKPTSANDLKLTIVRPPETTISRMVVSADPTTTKLPCPPKLETAWVYMTCYLMMLSWGDGRANSFFEVVKNEIKE